MQAYCSALTHEQLETHRCVISTVATDDLVLKVISNHSADENLIVSDKFH